MRNRHDREATNGGDRSRPWWAQSRRLALVCFAAASLGLLILALIGLLPASEDSEAASSIASGQSESEHLEAAIAQLKINLQANPGDAVARRRLGELYLRAGDGASGEKELRAAIELGTETDDLVHLVLRSQLLQAQFKEVIAALDSRNDLSSSNSESKLIRGEALLGLRRLEEAARTLGEAASLDPQNPRVLTKLAEVMTQMGDLDLAEQRVDQALALDAKAPQSLLLKGELRRLKGSPGQAIDYFDRILAASPDEPAARTARVAALLDRGQDQAAKLELQRLKEGPGLNPMAIYFEAVILARENDYRSAQSLLLQIGAALSRSASVQRFRASLHYALEEYEQARALLGRILKADPGSIPTQKLLAATLIKLKEPRKAIEVLTETLARAPADPVVRTLLSNAYLSVKDYRAATRVFEGDFGGTSMGAGPDGVMVSSVATLEQESPLELALPHFVRALEHLASGQLEQVDSVAGELARLDPESPLVDYLAATRDLELGNPGAALTAFERVAAALPNFLPAQISLAELYLRSGSFQQAEALASKIQETWPERFEPLLLTAEVHWRNDRPEASLRYIEKAVRQAPRALQPRLASIRRHLDLGEVTHARSLARETSLAFPSEPALMSLLAEIEMEHGSPAQAVAHLSRLVDAHPNDHRHRQRLAEALLAIGDRRAARLQLGHVFEQGGRQASVLLALIDIELAEQDRDAAGAYAQSLATAAGEDPRVASVLAALYQRHGYIAEAIAAYEMLWRKEQSKETAIALYRLKTINQIDPETALAPLIDWLDAHPEDTAARHFLAYELMINGTGRPAVEAYESLLRVEPDNPVILNNLAWLYHEAADPKALEFAERAFASVPEEAAVMDTLGWILLDQDQLTRAEGLLSEAVRRAPEDPEVRFHYAVLLERSGRRDQAKRILEALLSDPSGFRSAAAAQALLNKVDGK